MRTWGARSKIFLAFLLGDAADDGEDRFPCRLRA